ncbi:MAG: hypothetical protein EBT03_09415 [Betaproteobacteria bacterium]|nr:hypothetical protein [Betaproteobacteria bacterium]NCA17246.1 hypothetical protein [Betaproteobacteria bacterium]
MGNLYISFDDSNSDPTYCGADVCLLVEATEGDGNPCASPTRCVPVIPVSPEEIALWAEMVGWQVTVVDGEIVLRTGTAA